MTRSSKLALVTLLVSLLTWMQIGSVSACELDGAESCERVVLEQPTSLQSWVAFDASVMGLIPEGDGINAEAPIPDATSCSVASSPCEM